MDCSFIYHGTSMIPTFKVGQLIRVQPVADVLYRGDVVVFANKDELIVHRIVALTSAGVQTRGDHNLKDDTMLIPYDQVIGRVYEVNDPGVKKKIQGGERGWWVAQVRWLTLVILARLRLVIRIPYRIIRGSSYIRKWARYFLKQQLEFIVLQTPQGLAVKALHKGRVVARLKPEGSYFECIKPYDLWLDKADLTSWKIKENSTLFNSILRLK